MNAPEKILVVTGDEAVAPFANGIDASAFNRHYAASLGDRKQQWLQRLFTAWHFYLEPLGFGFFPGKLFCDFWFGTHAGLPLAVLCGGLSCLLIGPTWVHTRLRDNTRKRFYVHYVAALERCHRPPC